MIELPNVLVVDDEIEITSFFSYLLENKPCQVSLANSAKEVNDILANTQTPLHLALVDLKLPDANGLDLLAKIKQRHPSCEVIMMTGYSAVQSAIAAMQMGAKDYLEKPFDDLDSLESLIDSILKHPEQPKCEVSAEAARYGIFYSPHSPMKNVMDIAHKLAKKNISILIEGETGTGKELMARFIHGSSLRSSFPFVGVNCGAVLESLLESELFGHEKGSFTGADKTRKGYFELANNGTLFLDEIGEAPHSIQVKLLRAIETGEFRRVGSEQTLIGHIRFISATNRKLEEEVEKQRFRSDLLYRLDGVRLQLPALRERKQDIATICEQYLLKKYEGAYEIHPHALDILTNCEWSGNIRQLLNVLNQTIAIHDCQLIRAEHLPKTLWKGSDDSQVSAPPLPSLDSSVDQEIEKFVDHLVRLLPSAENIEFQALMNKLKHIETEVGRRIIQKGLAETRGNRRSLSSKLRISSRAIRYILNEK
ncbi:sigma-54-dependent transcriptional regulator [Ammoniphilus sp. 3BR4]|uniref:sigma-54-dependent transcriptional regulator n=1 Tax=Ammoniphilus sp. 3BR4 TaxID=3158265 RepID=UPI003467CC48